MILTALAEKIRAQREKRGLKQADIANALGISPQAVSKWERGENAPDIATLRPLARLLGVSTDWLLAVNEDDRDVFDAAVLVSSVRGAHERSLGMAPRDFALWANGIFYSLTQASLEAGAVPIKYMGDQFLCFFAGAEACPRALRAARQAQAVTAEELKIGLSYGRVYLGSVGHPDYARPDIMGEVVNLAFLTHGWVDDHPEHDIAMTETFARGLGEDVSVQAREEVHFRSVKAPVTMYALEKKG